MTLLARTGAGRDINRHYFEHAEIEAALLRPVVKDLLRLIRLRSSHAAFVGHFEVSPSGDDLLMLRWRAGMEFAELAVSFVQDTCELRYSDAGEVRQLSLECFGTQ